MSRIGKLPIELPSGVKVTLKAAGVAFLEGPKGKLDIVYPDVIQVRLENNLLHFKCPKATKENQPFYGLTRTLFYNAVCGVTQGFQKELELHGVGYRAELKGNALQILLGYSHPVNVPIPDGIEVKVEKQTKIIIGGMDKVRVGQIAADIRGFRTVEPYKLKGIRYAGERLHKKTGKTSA